MMQQSPKAHPSAAISGRWPRLVSMISPPLGLAFVALGGVKRHADERSVRQFAEWGLQEDMLVVAGIIEILLGLLLFFGPTRRYGAAGLVVWMMGAVGIHLRADEAIVAGLPVLLLSFFAAVALHDFRAHGWSVDRLPAPLHSPPNRVLPALFFAVQIVGTSFLIRWAISGIVFWASLPMLALGHAWLEGATRDARRVVDLVLLYLLVLGVSVGSFYGFVGHFFMSDTVAASVGWSTGSPFQHELAFYHLGFGISGLLALWLRDNFWLAVGMTCSIFLYGAGWVHLTDYLLRDNVAPSNWGFGVVFGNVILPTVILSLLAVRLRFRLRDPSRDVATQRPLAGGAI